MRMSSHCYENMHAVTSLSSQILISQYSIKSDTGTATYSLSISVPVYLSLMGLLFFSDDWIWVAILSSLYIGWVILSTHFTTVKKKSEYLDPTKAGAPVVPPLK